jgi:hypothetical protein
MQAAKTITRRKAKVNRAAVAGRTAKKAKPSDTLHGIRVLLDAAQTAMAGLLKDPLQFDLAEGPMDFSTEKPILDSLLLVDRALEMLGQVNNEDLDHPADYFYSPVNPKHTRRMARLLDLASAGYGAAA